MELLSKLFVGSEWIDAAAGGVFEVCDPATGQVLATVADGGAADAERAIEAAAAVGRDGVARWHWSAPMSSGMRLASCESASTLWPE